MAVEIEITGNITREDSMALRALMEGPQVGFSSGLSGERVLKVIGELTAKQVEAIRHLLLRLLGDDRITGLEISKDGIKVDSVSGKNLEALKVAITDLSKLI